MMLMKTLMVRTIRMTMMTMTMVVMMMMMTMLLSTMSPTTMIDDEDDDALHHRLPGSRFRGRGAKGPRSGPENV